MVKMNYQLWTMVYGLSTLPIQTKQHTGIENISFLQV